MKDLITYRLLFFVILLAGFGSGIIYIYSISSSPKEEYSLVVKQNNDGWFYEIHSDDNILIKQETIPALAGNHHFLNEMDAQTIGSIVLNKVQQGVMPPTISLEDIERNHIKTSEH